MGRGEAPKGWALARVRMEKRIRGTEMGERQRSKANLASFTEFPRKGGGMIIDQGLRHQPALLLCPGCRGQRDVRECWGPKPGSIGSVGGGPQAEG